MCVTRISLRIKNNFRVISDYVWHISAFHRILIVLHFWSRQYVTAHSFRKRDTPIFLSYFRKFFFRLLIWKRKIIASTKIVSCITFYFRCNLLTATSLYVADPYSWYIYMHAIAHLISMKCQMQNYGNGSVTHAYQSHTSRMLFKCCVYISRPF